MGKYIDITKVKLTASTSVDSEGDVLVSLADVRKALEQAPAADVVEGQLYRDCVKRLENQRKELRCLTRALNAASQSANHFKREIKRLGKQLHEVLEKQKGADNEQRETD